MLLWRSVLQDIMLAILEKSSRILITIGANLLIALPQMGFVFSIMLLSEQLIVSINTEKKSSNSY